MRLLDSDVMIDILRQHPPAIAWLRQIAITTNEELRLPGFVIIELMAGCQNKQEMRQTLKLVRQFTTYWPSPAECNMALMYFEKGYLSHNLGPFDALIGACAVGLGVPLCTFNVKHFRSIPGLTIEQPYKK